MRTRPRFDEEAHDSSEMGYWKSVMFVLDYSRTPLIRPPIGSKKLAALTGGRINDGLFTRKCKAVFARQPKNVAVITR